MKQLLLILAIGAAGNTFSQTTIWGAGSGNATSESLGQFENAFGTANAWTAVDVTPNAFWTRPTNGLTQGAYAAGMQPMNSPSMANGAALFDSDYLDNGGTQGAFGTGTCASPHRGELHSPVIDLTGYTDSLLEAKFYLYYRNFQINEISIGFSSNGGTTWTDFSFNQGVAVNSAFDPAYVTIPLTDVTVGVSDLTNCKLRLTFNGDYYFVMVDDLSLQVACSAPVAPTNTTAASAMSVCPDGSTTLTASGSGTLGWYDAANNYLGGGSSFTTSAISSETTFYVQDSTCYASTRTPVTVSITQPVTFVQTLTLCPDETVTVGSNTYSVPGVFTDSLTTAAGCDSIVITDLYYTNIDVNVTTVDFTLSADILSNATFQWVDCNNGYAPINGATSQSYTATANGSYAVIITWADCSDTSACYAISTIGLSENQSPLQVNLFPNPAKTTVTVQSSEAIQAIDVYSIDGTFIKRTSSTIVPVDELSQGIYLLEITTATRKATARLVKE